MQGKDLTHAITESADVCVIGSGAGGAILSWEMAELGHTVVLLEKGGYHPREDFDQKEDNMIPMLYKNSGLQFTIPSGIAVAQGSCVGGSTVVNDAVCFRTPDPVLGWWTDRFKIENISPESMKKYFDKVEKRISVSEVQPYELNKNNLILKKGAERLGWAAGVNSRNCKNCKQCGNCQIGCYYGTKQSMLETYIPDIQTVHGNLVKIYSDTNADTLTKSGSKVSGVKATVTGKDGRTFNLSVKARLVIVSAGTIASSQLLLQSNLNVNGHVGEGVAIHPSPAMIGDFEEEINGNQGIPMAYHCHEFSVLNTGNRGYMLESIFLPPYQFSLPLPGIEYEHKELMSRYPHYALVGSLLQDESVGEVNLGGPMGAILTYELTNGDAKMMIAGMKSAAKALFAAGATRVITSHRRRTILYSDDDLHLIDERGVSPDAISIGSGHPQGGNRMGGVVQNSVVDSYSKVYGFDNLFVCDASIFPTSIGVNPQLTVMALATRAAENIGENWSKYTEKM
ncbi:MAG: GMC family oxidoreductase N-terminal domain-containing protein [Nitrososphaerales archaeon]